MVTPCDTDFLCAAGHGILVETDKQGFLDHGKPEKMFVRLGES